jgi:hypothetical protein
MMARQADAKVFEERGREERVTYDGVVEMVNRLKEREPMAPS